MATESGCPASSSRSITSAASMSTINGSVKLSDVSTATSASPRRTAMLVGSPSIGSVPAGSGAAGWEVSTKPSRSASESV
jgi:hypothetical protein